MPPAFSVFIHGSSLRHVDPAQARMERIWPESGREVCILRPTGLNDEPATGRARVVPRVVGRATVPRGDEARKSGDGSGTAPHVESRSRPLLLTF